MNALAIAATPPTTTPMMIWVVLSLDPWSSSDDGECESARGERSMLKRPTQSTGGTRMSQSRTSRQLSSELCLKLTEADCSNLQAMAKAMQGPRLMKKSRTLPLFEN